MKQLADPAIRHWDFPRGVASVCLLVRFGEEYGLSGERLLAGSGLTPEQLADPAGVLEARQELQVVRNLASELPELGLVVGREYHATTFGMFGFAFISSPTVRDAVDFALRYLDLSFTFSIPKARLEDGQVRMEIDDSTLPGDIADFLVARDLAAIYTVISELLPTGVPLTGLDLRMAEPSEVDMYEETFGVEPRFGRPANVASFDARYLDRPLPQANPQTVAFCEAQCRELVSRRRSRAGIANDVRERLVKLGALQEGMPRIARELNMSTRTLRRKLEEAGTSFRMLSDEVREALAEELLTTGALSIEDVATRLGYAEASSFIHAFKRWKGTTPAAFLRNRGI
ncbi:AraC family transcriptional regulator [Amycolatopsis sp. K13G38]|uniref:AraC family transcriptional regulator n=1 Tax=Amycolatopsis acididurans TaxID=2724524 RepID=A0ABX1JG86_9PSEU|nr:AraC family transcriptional regulator [Amycolatopsis acididurans]NKQ57430.1 AraC family transcriptional regulator [Amycolatopsis acididurans]